MKKENIRAILLKLREAQPIFAKNRKDKKIMNRLIRLLVFRQAKEFFAYISHRGEVSTDDLIKKFIGKKKIMIPKVKGKRICLFELLNADQFVKGKFGVREPLICARQMDFKRIDVALVPGIAFDETGHRIGFGGGYFDRFLKKTRCTTIGLAYEFQIVDKVPARHYDVPVNYIVTEKRVIECGREQK